MEETDEKQLDPKLWEDDKENKKDEIGEQDEQNEGRHFFNV